MIRAGTKAFQYIVFFPACLVCRSLLMVGFVTAGNGGFVAALNSGEWESRSLKGVSEEWELD